MTEQEFINKWKHLLSDHHPSYSAQAGPLYWCASYDEKADHIKELTNDYLSTNPAEGMSKRRAERIKRS